MIKNYIHIREKLKVIKFSISKYIEQNMGPEFQYRKNNDSQISLYFTTKSGLRIDFDCENSLESENNSHNEYIHIKGQLYGQKVEVNIHISQNDSGSGSIYFGNYGLYFENIEVANNSAAKSFRVINGKKVSLFSSGTIDKEFPSVIDEIAEDVRTMRPEDNTIKYLRKPEGSSIPSEINPANIIRRIKEIEQEKAILLSYYDIFTTDSLILEEESTNNRK